MVRQVPSPDELKQFNWKLIAEFRANDGQVEGWHSLLLLTTVGARSNKPHTTPLVYSTDGDRIVIVAAAVGAPKHPSWYYNLLAHPEVTVELDDTSKRMRAVVAEGQEYERLFIKHAEQFPVIVDYQEKTVRRIPIVVLEKID